MEMGTVPRKSGSRVGFQVIPPSLQMALFQNLLGRKFSNLAQTLNKVIQSWWSNAKVMVTLQQCYADEDDISRRFWINFFNLLQIFT